VKGWQLLVVIALVCGATAITYFVIHPIIEAGPAYIEAESISPPILRSDQVHYLSDQDFSKHPALVELLKKRKRVLRPGSTLNFLLGFFGGPRYSWMPISREEEQEISSLYRSVLAFNGTYYQITFHPDTS
jgi:hypothetical protein